MNDLLVDIGNSRVKWACHDGATLAHARAARHAGWSAREFERIVRSARHSGRILVSSVAATDINAALERAARRLRAPQPQFVTTRRRACGVTVAYLEPWRLGVDRFLGMIGARAHFPRRPVCVVGIGTAMTIDLLGADGRHRGGAIIPAPPLMVASLLNGTHGIRRRAQGGTKGDGAGLFGHSTRAGLERGAQYAAAAAVDRAVREARTLVRRTPLVVLTGGGARELRPRILSASLEIPDLVLWGLAVWAREG